MINNIHTNINRCHSHSRNLDKNEELISIVYYLSQLNRQCQVSNHAHIPKFDNCTSDITYSECYNQFIAGSIEDFLSRAMIKTFALYETFKINRRKSWDMTCAYFEELSGQEINSRGYFFHTVRKVTDIKYAVFPEDHLYELCARLMYFCKYMKIDGDRIIDLRIKYESLK